MKMLLMTILALNRIVSLIIAFRIRKAPLLKSVKSSQATINNAKWNIV